MHVIEVHGLGQRINWEGGGGGRRLVKEGEIQILLAVQTLQTPLKK